MITYRGLEYDPEAMIGAGEAASIAEHGRRTILYWCREGHLKSVKMPGVRGRYQIRTGDLIELLTKPGAATPAT